MYEFTLWISDSFALASERKAHANGSEVEEKMTVQRKEEHRYQLCSLWSVKCHYRMKKEKWFEVRGLLKSAAVTNAIAGIGCGSHPAVVSCCSSNQHHRTQQGSK